MSVCKHCSAIGGYHTLACPMRYAPEMYARATAQIQTRVEWCGNIQVHHPVKPGVAK